MSEQSERMLTLQRRARAQFLAQLEDYQRIAEHGPDGSARDTDLVKRAISMIIGDVFSVGGDLYINAGN